MFDSKRNQIIGAAVFVFMLISIPLSFSLVKQSQIFKSHASESNSDSLETLLRKAQATPSASLSPTTSPLDEIKKMTEVAGSGTPTPGSLGASTDNLAFGPTLSFKVTLEGRPVGKNAAKLFVGIASGTPAKTPTYLLSFTVDLPDSGEFSGLSLAGLNPGSVYTAYLKGPVQLATSSAFTMAPNVSSLNNSLPLTLLTGDLNQDNIINSADYTIAKNAYGSTSASSNWNPAADFNLDGVVNNVDLGYILKNFSQTGTSGTWYSPPPATGSGVPVGGPESTSSGNYWLWVPQL